MRALSVVSSIISSLSFLIFSADMATLSQLSDESRLAQCDFPAGFCAAQRSPAKIVISAPTKWQLVPTAAVRPHAVSTIFDSDGHI
jgi:hypothetical protein